MKTCKDYKSYVGTNYDLSSATQFNLLTLLGLREHHYLLDIGCGSLRGGKLFIPYLLPERYCGIEPNPWLISKGIEEEIGWDIICIKKPRFDSNDGFNCNVFDKKFDFILAQSIFSHASWDQISKCLYEAKKVMKPKSIFVATFVEGEQNYKGTEWVYPGCVTYTYNYLEFLIQRRGMCCARIDYPHPNMQTWILITLQKNIVSLNCEDDTILLNRKLDYCKKRLQKLQNHPYVKFGLFLQRMYGRIV